MTLEILIFLTYFLCELNFHFDSLHNHSRGCFRQSRTITLTIYELVAPGRRPLLGGPRPMLPGYGPSSPTKLPQTSQKPLTSLNENGRTTFKELL